MSESENTESNHKQAEAEAVVKSERQVPETLVHDAREEGADGSLAAVMVAQDEVLPSRASPALLQAILLASGEPVSFSKLQEIMRCSKTEVLAELKQLQEITTLEASGVEVVTVGEKLQLRTKAAFAEAVRELLAVRPRKLSQPALETLSVVAYQQPIVKSEIDKIRGVDVAPTLKTLMERKLIKIIGYQASVGQPSLYGTTEEFLRVFGLESLGALPPLRDLKALAKDPGETQGEETDSGTSEEGDNGDSSRGEEAANQDSAEGTPHGDQEQEVVNV